MDVVRRWGDGATTQIHPGQSLAELRWGGFALGATSANVLRGSEVRYPLVLGATAPGVPAAFAEAHSRLGPLGLVGFRLQYGLLRESPWFDDDPDNDRLLHTLLALDWEPAFLPGLALGLTSSYRDPIEDGVAPFMLLQPFKTRSAQSEEQAAEDAMAAAHARWETASATVWGAWGRGDGALDVEDLLTDTDHNQFWALGARVPWTGAGGAEWSLVGEAFSATGRALRDRRVGAVPSTHRHGSATQGHTHLGQPLGPSPGPGSRGLWLRVARTAPEGATLGVEAERLLRDLEVHMDVLRRRDGASGEDREWRLAALYEGLIPAVAGGLSRVPGLSVRANGGVSLRWNRDYVRYSANADQVGARESQLFLDLALTWDPRAR
jgi:hypothetical protein